MLILTLTLLFFTGLGVIVPRYIKRFVQRKTNHKVLGYACGIVTGIAILVIGFTQIFSLMVSAIVLDYPVVRKKINDDLYFTQQEYGWAPGMPGKHLNFYEKIALGLDKKIGHIQWREGIGNIETKLSIEYNKWRLTLTQENNLVLDTLISNEAEFDFVYKPWPR